MSKAMHSVSGPTTHHSPLTTHLAVALLLAASCGLGPSGAEQEEAAKFVDLSLLVSPEYSAEMKEILSHPGIHHKFVKGLEGTGSEIYRKSGTWSKYHADGALIVCGWCSRRFRLSGSPMAW